jgi:methionine salvage enolase-phosphatase E1
MYDDAIEAFERWTSQSYKLYIYSSGSVAAQRLLFGYTMAGDLTKVCSGSRLDETLTREQYLSGYFDTTSGPKVDSQSYKTIAQSIGVLPSNVLFLTDNVKGRLHCMTGFLLMARSQKRKPASRRACCAVLRTDLATQLCPKTTVQ